MINLKLLSPFSQELALVGQEPVDRSASQESPDLSPKLDVPLKDVPFSPEEADQVMSLLDRHDQAYTEFRSRVEEFERGVLYAQIIALNHQSVLRGQYIEGVTSLLDFLNSMKDVFMSVHEKCQQCTTQLDSLILKASAQASVVKDEPESPTEGQATSFKSHPLATLSANQLSFHRYIQYSKLFLEFLGILAGTTHLFFQGGDHGGPNLSFDADTPGDNKVYDLCLQLFDDIEHFCSHSEMFDKAQRELGIQVNDPELRKQFVHSVLQFCRYFSSMLSPHHSNPELKAMLKRVADFFYKFSFDRDANSCPTLMHDEGYILTTVMDLFSLDEGGKRLTLGEHPYKNWFKEAIQAIPFRSRIGAQLAAIDIKFAWTSGDLEEQKRAAIVAGTILQNPEADQIDLLDSQIILAYDCARRVFDLNGDYQTSEETLKATKKTTKTMRKGEAKAANQAAKRKNEEQRIHIILDLLDLTTELLSYTGNAFDNMTHVGLGTRNFTDFCKVFLSVFPVINDLVKRFETDPNTITHRYGILRNLTAFAQIVKKAVDKPYIEDYFAFNLMGSQVIYTATQMSQIMTADIRHLTIDTVRIARDQATIEHDEQKRAEQEARFEALLQEETRAAEARKAEELERQRQLIKDQEARVAAEEKKRDEELQKLKEQGMQVGLVYDRPQLTEAQSRFGFFRHEAKFRAQSRDYTGALDMLTKCQGILDIDSLRFGAPEGSLLASAVVRFEDVKEPDISSFDRCEVYLLQVEMLLLSNHSWVVLTPESVASIDQAKVALDKVKYHFQALKNPDERRVIQTNLHFFHELIVEAERYLRREAERLEEEHTASYAEFQRYIKSPAYRERRQHMERRPASQRKPDPRHAKRKDMKAKLAAISRVLPTINQCIESSRYILAAEHTVAS